MILPAFVYFMIFSILPLFGLLFAFSDYNIALGLAGSDWVGLKHFQKIFTDPYMLTLISNTVIFSLLDIVIVFPLPIILASLMSAAKNKPFSKAVKTAVYMPYFISIVVVCGMIRNFTSSTGFIGAFFQSIGQLESGYDMLIKPDFFKGIITSTNLWQQMGFNSIIFVAAIAGIDSTLYEAAVVDGANRWKQYWHVTFPSILPTIMMMLIIKIGGILNVGFEKIYLLYNPLTYGVADVLSTYIYRLGVEGNQLGLTTAVGLLNSIISFVLLMGANTLSARLIKKSMF